MVNTQDMSVEDKQALAASKLDGLKKQLNAESWSDQMEELMKAWGEKAAGLRFMHNNAAGHWKAVSNKYTLMGIVLSAVMSTASLASASVEDPVAKNVVMYTVGGIGVASTLVQAVKKFYNADEKVANHASTAKQFGSLYRYMTLQLGTARADREAADQFSTWTLKEYERLQMDAPTFRWWSNICIQD